MKHQKRTVLDQFTKQACSFAGAATIRHKRALELLLAATHASAEDAMLDVACGPGIVVCAFAEVTRHATGVDLVPAMIEQARSLQRSRGLKNVSWKVADVTVLPYTDASFSIVTSRYAFHHLQNSYDVLAEMKRVCKTKGKVALIDVMTSEDPTQAEKFNHVEKLRDPSHVRALPLSAMKALFCEVGLLAPEITDYRLELELESFLQRSFPEDGNAEKVRALIHAAVENDDLGINARRDGDTVKFTYPIAVLVSEKDT